MGAGFLGLCLRFWWDAQGDWEKAHEVAQDVAGRMGPGCMPICTGRKAIWGMLVIGIGRRGGRWRVGI